MIGKRICKVIAEIYLYTVNVIGKNIAQFEIKIVELYCIIKICAVYKFVCPITLCRISLFKRKPIKTKTIITDVKQNLFGFCFVCYCHTPASQEIDLSFQC